MNHKKPKQFIFQHEPPEEANPLSYLWQFPPYKDDDEVEEYEQGLSTLTGESKMPFGRYIGSALKDVPPDYLLDLHEAQNLTHIKLPIDFGALYLDADKIEDIPSWYLSDVMNVKEYPDVLLYIDDNFQDLLENSIDELANKRMEKLF
jgi:Putative quorum-sensing-regulated virulence factor